MDTTQNQSKLQVLFGEEIGANEKRSLRVEVHVGKQKANEQANKVKQLVFNQFETSTSLAFVFPCLEANQQNLVQLIDSIFEGSLEAALSKNVAGHVSEGRILYNVIKNQNKVILVIRPAGEFEQIAATPAEMLLGTPEMKGIVDTHNNSIILDIKSGISVKESDEAVQAGESFITVLLKSLKVSLTFDLHQNIFKAIMELVEAIDPSLTQSPLGLLLFLKSFNIDLKLAGAQDLPDGIKALFSKSALNKGTLLPESLMGSDQKFLKDLTSLIEPGVEVFATIENFVGIHLQTNLPGYGAYITKNFKKEN